MKGFMKKKNDYNSRMQSRCAQCPVVAIGDEVFISGHVKSITVTEYGTFYDVDIGKTTFCDLVRARQDEITIQNGIVRASLGREG